MSENTIITISPAAGIVIPDLDKIPQISEIAGKNPPAENLKDHPEWDGLDIIIMNARELESTIKDSARSTYFVCDAFVLDIANGEKPSQENQIVLMTGAGNVADRVAAAIVAKALPMRGKLRNSGRAWFLD